MAEKVKMQHPDLDEEIEVSESAAAVHELSGWKRVNSTTTSPGTQTTPGSKSSTPMGAKGEER